MSNVRVEDGPKILHTRRDEIPKVAKFYAQRIRVGFEQLRGDLVDLPFTIHKRRSERRRKIPLSNHVGEIRDFTFQRSLAPAHLLQFPVKVVQRLHQFSLESFKNVLNRLWSHYLLLQSVEQSVFECVTKNSDAVCANTRSTESILRAAIHDIATSAPPPVNNADICAALAALQQTRENVRRTDGATLHSAFSPNLAVELLDRFDAYLYRVPQFFGDDALLAVAQVQAGFALEIAQVR